MALTYKRTWAIDVGGEDVTLGLLTTVTDDLTGSADYRPAVYAAGCTYQDLRLSRCGFGATPAEAVADFLRLLRPAATWPWG